MIETALILAIISLCGTLVTGAFTLFGKIKKSSCGILSCESHNTIADVIPEVVAEVVHHSPPPPPPLPDKLDPDLSIDENISNITI